MVEYAPFLHKYLDDLHQTYASLQEGEVADYIPELTKVDADAFGIAIVTVDGHVYQTGDTRLPFTIQSISKPLTYGIALEDNGVEDIFSKINVEPSGEAFNRISLEHATGRPRNPMINAGAIAASALVSGDTPAEKIQRILDVYSKYAGHGLIIDYDVFRSEKSTGHRNRAIGHMLRNANILDQDIDEVLDVYFQQCSINVTCRDLANMAATLANEGVNPVTGVRALSSEHVPRVLSAMATCGMYDGSGEWLYQIGLPAKSGVGGGIIAVLPDRLGIAVFSPRLDAKGNSARGIAVCRALSQDLNLHAFSNERYSSVDVIRTAYNLTQMRSKKARNTEMLEVLSRDGHKVAIIEASGELMFTTSEILTSYVCTHTTDARHIVIDLRRASSCDKAAAQLIIWLDELLQSQNKTLILTGTADKSGLTKYIKQIIGKEKVKQLFAIDDLEQALVHYENILLEDAGISPFLTEPVPLEKQPLCESLTPDELGQLTTFLVERSFPAGEYVCHAGDQDSSLYFLIAGEIGIYLPLNHDRHQHIATICAGGSFGEQAMLEQRKRSADVVAITDSKCLMLDYEKFAEHKDERDIQVLQLKLLSAIALDLSKKLRMADQEIGFLTF